ncbi:Beta-galactosidase 3 [Linum perenne]
MEKLFFFFGCCFLLCCEVVFAGNVTYDGRSLIIDGQRRLLISAAIHYPRSVPAMWPGLVQTAKEGGVDTIETYVFWNGHEIAPSVYNFEGRYDLVKFVKIVQKAGLYFILRIGPYIGAEWNYGGVPVWLHYIPRTIFRTDNENFKNYMQSFVTYIVNLMKKENLFASQGGPIILAQARTTCQSIIRRIFIISSFSRAEFIFFYLQVENEYGFVQEFYGDGGKQYANWAAAMAVAQNIGVPWIMCTQFDVPDLMINTCNSFYCDDFKPLYPNVPKLWTENWSGWCQTFGSTNPHRSAEDLAFSVARFFQKGGSLNNYYMYHGGTNFGRTAGGPFITSSYDYDAPIDEYGLPRLPKWGHLKELHRAIKSCENVLLTSQPISISVGPSQEADVYADASGACVAFLANSDAQNDMTVIFRNASYYLPAWSVSILPDCKNEVFNTAKVTSQASVVEMVPEELRPSVKSLEDDSKTLNWEVFVEKAGIWGEADLVKNSLEDQIDITKDSSDYLWYTTSITISNDEQFLKQGQPPVLTIASKGHALRVFINGELQGSASGSRASRHFEYRKPITLKAGKNEISLLSMTVGLICFGHLYEWDPAGLTSVKIEGLNNQTMDLSTYDWTYKVCFFHRFIPRLFALVEQPYWYARRKACYTFPRQYEQCKLDRNSKCAEYAAFDVVQGMHLVELHSHFPGKEHCSFQMQFSACLQAIVDPPTGDEPVGLDMMNMGKGLAWLNGEEIGRYWLRESPKDDRCVEECDYRGALVLNFDPVVEYFPQKCNTGCGEPTQRWYHVPRSWFKPSNNVLVVFEETGGDPTTIKFSKRRTSGVCASVGEDYPSNTVHLKCPKDANISSVKFASFGTPTGACGSYKVGDCHHPDSISFVEKECLNRNECSIQISEEKFGTGNCNAGSSMKKKKLAVEVVCGGS